jgi:RNA polymerase sigma factor (sigma-70 family)
VKHFLGPARSGEWDDACQAAFVRVWEGLKTWEPRGPFCKWLAVVAAHVAVDFRRRPSFIPLPPYDPPAPPPRSPPLAPEEKECIRRKLAGFPEDWRRVWEWHFGGVNHKEIACRVGKSLRTIQYWLAEMRQQLSQCLER